jgi:hypothetical protein
VLDLECTRSDCPVPGLAVCRATVIGGNRTSPCSCDTDLFMDVGEIRDVSLMGLMLVTMLAELLV